MMSSEAKLRCLDLGSCWGGAAKGYQDAGMYVIGVDVVDHSGHNPADEFVVMDALDAVEEYAGRVDFIHASPPCQRYTHGNAGREAANRHPDLIGPWRDAIQATGLPYVIENVPRAPLVDPVTLCGTQFGLTALDDDGTWLYLQRHRMFESNWGLTAPAEHVHPRGVQWAGAYGGARRDKLEARLVRKGGYVPPNPAVLRSLLGIPWMDEAGLFQSLPPAYTTWIGNQLRAALEVAA